MTDLRLQRCANCKHWDRDEGDGDYSFCGRIKHRSDASREESPAAYVSDAEDWQASLNTASNFGCVLWEERLAR